ncbi:receptor like protein 22-like [Salvia hispanica]|uniref:receptor like protein 22-like n=1 Tax=Salvia hispanica TaxID=49212 RepID=UPI002009AB81|nr:receptor like protein 22-like [Salvia hispanica]
MLPNLLFICILSSIFTHSHSQCLPNQQTILLQLKKELIFNSTISTKLVQWNQSDEWHGVECDAAGNVVSLQLDHEAISGGMEDSSSLFKLVYLQKLNLAYNDFSILPIPKGIPKLTYLTHLNLSYAGFDGQVPSEILSLGRLVSLDMSNEYTSLTLEHPNLEMLLQNLTGLRELYLDGVGILSSHEKTKWSHIISSYAPNITRLSMRFCLLSGPLAKSFWKLRFLSVLRLDSNDLSTVVPDLFAGFTSLTTLSLIGCQLNSSFHSKLFQIPSLQNVDLSENSLSGSIGPFLGTGSFESLVLTRNNFSGSIPSSIGNLENLSMLDLSFCQFSGTIPSTFANLTKLVHVDLQYNLFTGSIPTALFEGLSNLSYLRLNSNSFSGHIPHSLFALPSMKRLHLKSNKFTGLVEEFPIVNVSSMVLLDLRDNRLEGPIPSSLFQLQSLELLLLSGNMFNGTVQLDKIRDLANLTSLDLSGNNLLVDGGDDNSSTYGPSRIQDLSLGSCNLRVIPGFLKDSDIRNLDLSDNRIVGGIPSWIWEKQLKGLDLSLNLFTDLEKPYHIPASLEKLDLHSNQLKGDLQRFVPPNITSNLETLLLGNNSFSGTIPTSLCNVSSLFAIDLSSNNLSGSIPPCLIENILELDLGRNSLSGGIPDNFPTTCLLNYLDLHNNTLEGKIPRSLKGCESLAFLNIGNNMINDTFPCILPPSLHVLVLHTNRFHGEVKCHKDWPELQILDISSNNFSGRLESVNFSSWKRMTELQGDDDTSLFTSGVIITMKGMPREYGGILSDFGTIDFSSNDFQGQIPDAVGDLISLHQLNFSHNAVSGSIPKSLGKMGMLESLDLSYNRLTGRIPAEIGGLTFLGFLNLSYNDLGGQIPNGPQLQNFQADSFRGNPKLCGFNLNVTCIRSDNNDSSEHENVEDKREVEWKYVFAALGFVVGVGIVVWLLLFCRRFREKYFNKIDDIVDGVFEAINKRRHVKT